MSYYNPNRHNSIGGNWHVGDPAEPASQHSDSSASGGYASNTSASSASAPIDLRAEQAPGFRNPWYAAPAPPQLSPTKTPNLPQQQRRLSYATQLPTTYEDRRQSIAPPYVHPPTRVDNPFNQYYAAPDVSLGADRRMSAAGMYAGGGFMQMPPLGPYPAPGAPPPPPGPLAAYGAGAASGAAIAASRRGSAYPPFDARVYNPLLQVSPSASPSRSHSIVQYNQYQADLQRQRAIPARRAAPRMRPVHNRFDLRPKQNRQPKYRRCSINSIHISPLNALTVYLTESYGICQPRKFQYSKSTNPKRVLTKPSEPRFNNGCDNEDSDYILYVNDILGTEEGRKYIVLDLLGCGTFGQVVKCQNLQNQSLCAVKVIKAKPAYINQSFTEVKLLEFLNANADGHFIRLLDTFMHKEHLCLVFELLASNLYELIKQNHFQGLNMRLVKLLARQLLESLTQLKSFQMVHCDLKPENILLCKPDKPDIKVIDFGSACFTRQTTYTYIQSRFYRAPEVILGLPYTESIDMWSLGCIVGELYLGLPMFPGNSEYNQIWKIVDMLGNPPRHMIEVGRNSLNYFHRTPPSSPADKPVYRIKTMEEYTEWLRRKHAADADPVREEKPNKQYFKDKYLKDIILNYKLPSRMTASMIEREWEERFLLLDFLGKVLNMNPLERLTPQEALKHPFVNESADVAAKQAAIAAAHRAAGRDRQ
ncbi:Protein kinase domain-containing protein [[Candida] zeylanoides]